MTDEIKHPADAPEQEITSNAAEILEHAVPDEGPETTSAESAAPAVIADASPESESQEEMAEPRPAPKLERLQKILAQAGVASRRHAEELITEGRVQVNGKVVNVLGSKADPSRDHIRVDGKLLHGAERLRYFVLNKPKGFVTTVTDPEGRPTVMQFFAKTGERLYPVGRLDYQSEGLLLVTNDGELANRLTKAASRVEKTYLVKVAGQPSEPSLDRLRAGVAIEKDKPGGAKVHTAPARIRQVRLGDNPWYEVVLIEGRNRELRKMFEEIGHHVEKIRRVGYGPLVLDLEPGKTRELEPEEVKALQLTAEGKLKARRLKSSLMLPKEAGKSAEQRAAKTARGRRKFQPPDNRRTSTTGQPGIDRTSARPDRPTPRPDFKPGVKPFAKPFPKPGSRPFAKPGEGREQAPKFGNIRRAPSSAPRSFDRHERPAAGQPNRFPPKPGAPRPFRPRGEEASSPKPFTPKPGARKPFRDADSTEMDRPRFGLSIEPQIERESGSPSRPPAGTSRPARSGDREFRPPSPGRRPSRPAPGGRSFDRPNDTRRRFESNPNPNRPPRGEREFRPAPSGRKPARPAAEGKNFDRPKERRPPFGKPAGRNFTKDKGKTGGRSKSSYTSKPRAEGSRTSSGLERKPNGGTSRSRPRSGAPRPGGSRPSGPRPGGSRPSGPRAGGKRPTGRPSGKKRSGGPPSRGKRS
ncbi:MAG: pseudouridine synthase [Terracidiphilus sp.]